MEENAQFARFDLTGTFVGFVFTANGKRRMALRVADENCLFKVPRLLRRRVVGIFRSGQSLRVVGTEERTDRGIAAKRIVERIVTSDGSSVFAAEPVRAACVVKVCSKKNCWRSGGQQLLTALKDEVVACGLSDHVEIRAVGCLDRCKQAPNVDSPWREYRHCTPRDARAILAEVAQRAVATLQTASSDC